MLRYLLGNKLRIGGNGHFTCPPDRLIDLTDVIKAYKTDAGDFLALKGVNLTIGNGEFVGVIAIAACLLPVYHAIKMSIRETLAYE
jgi:hypothetical protein